MTRTGATPAPELRREYPNVGDGYELLEQIGQGTSATVYRAFCEATGEEVAIKIVDLEWFQASLEDIWREIQVMSLSAHPNVVPYSSSFVQGADLWVVMPLLTGGSALHFMQSTFPQGMEEDLARYVLFESLKAIAYFHANGQMHRDVKAANVLLNSSGNVMLSDYGVMGWMVESGMERKNRQTFVGTPCWMAPEVMEQAHGYDYKADIWSFGITAMELAQGRAPYVTYPPMKVLLLTLTNPPPDLEPSAEERYSQAFKDMVKLCLQKDPANRPTAEQLLSHKYFKNVTMPSNLPDLIRSLPALGSTADNQARLYRQLQKEKQGIGRSGIHERISRNCGWDFSGDADENAVDGDSVLKASMGPAKVLSSSLIGDKPGTANGLPPPKPELLPTRASSSQEVSAASLRTPPANIEPRVPPKSAPMRPEAADPETEHPDTKLQPQLPSAAVSAAERNGKLENGKLENGDAKMEPSTKANDKTLDNAKEGSDSSDSVSLSSQADNSPKSEKQAANHAATPPGSSPPSATSNAESVDGEATTAHQKRGRFVVVSDSPTIEIPTNTGDSLPPAPVTPAAGSSSTGQPALSTKESSRAKQTSGKPRDKRDTLQTSASEPHFKEPDPVKKPTTRYTVTKEDRAGPAMTTSLRIGPPPAPEMIRRGPSTLHNAPPPRTPSQQSDLGGHERLRPLFDETSHFDLLSALNEKFNWITAQHDAVKNEISRVVTEKAALNNERAVDKSLIAARDSDLQALSSEIYGLKSEKAAWTAEREALVAENNQLKTERIKLRREVDLLREKSPQRPS